MSEQTFTTPTNSLKIRIRPFNKNDEATNVAQKRVAFRINGGLVKFSKLDLTDDSIALELAEHVGTDPDAIDELVCNGCIRALRSAVMKGSDVAAEILTAIEQASSSALTTSTILDEETRHRPYWFTIENVGSVLMRYLKPSQKSKGNRANFEVGFTLWGASLVLSRDVVTDLYIKELLRGKNILELGAGMGLCGIVAAKFTECKSVTITDFHPLVVRNSKFNIELNGLPNKCEACVLDWEEESPPTELEGKVFDVIIGSDIVCHKDDCYVIARVLKQYLCNINGVAIFCIGSAESRYGVAEFPEILRSKGFKVEYRPDTNGDLASWVSATDGENDIDFLVGKASSYTSLIVTHAAN